ncbi:unnamed protein product [Absidia cylindrospora]
MSSNPENNIVPENQDMLILYRAVVNATNKMDATNKALSQMRSEMNEMRDILGNIVNMVTASVSAPQQRVEPQPSLPTDVHDPPRDMIAHPGKKQQVKAVKALLKTAWNRNPITYTIRTPEQEDSAYIGLKTLVHQVLSSVQDSMFDPLSEQKMLFNELTKFWQDSLISRLESLASEKGMHFQDCKYSWAASDSHEADNGAIDDDGINDGSPDLFALSGMEHPL